MSKITIQINAERVFDTIKTAFNELLDYKMQNCDIDDFVNYESYAKILKDLCIACDVLNYYKYDIIDKIEHNYTDFIDYGKE